MQDSFENKFKGIMVIKNDDNEEFNPEHYFSIYDYWEEYDSNKNYTKEKFLEKFVDIPYHYYWYLLICHINNNENPNYYVFVQKDTSFLSKWEHLCDCPHCISLNPKKWMSCKICSGCLKSGPLFYSKERLNRIKSYHEKKIDENDKEWILPNSPYSDINNNDNMEITN